MTDYRELCAELHAAFNTYAVDEVHHALLERARAALDQPEPEGPQPIPVSDRLPMTDLSPAAEAVLDAANGASSWGADDCLNESRWIAAAALQAAADQVVPETAPPLIGTPFVRWDAMDEIRAQLLVIAAELEAMPND
jgi:hypothetical protein